MENSLAEVKEVLKVAVTWNRHWRSVPELYRVCRVYRRIMGEDLPYRRFGYRSVVAFLRSIPDTVVVHTSGSRTWVMPNRRNSSAMPNRRHHGNARERANCACPTASNSPVPNTNHPPPDETEKIEPRPLPIYIPFAHIRKFVLFGDTIPLQLWPNTEDTSVPMHVNTICDLSKFWFSFECRDPELAQLKIDMNEFYHWYACEYEIEAESVRKGMYVCIKSRQSSAMRAIVVQTQPELYVFYIDFGNVAKVDLDDVYYLNVRFAELPRQALRGRVAGVRPLIGDDMWGKPTINRFTELALQKTLFAMKHITERVENEDNVYQLFLNQKAFPPFQGTFFIHRILLTEGHVLRICQQPINQRAWDGYIVMQRNLHFYPTFKHLENVSVPTLVGVETTPDMYDALPDIYPELFRPIGTVPQDNDIQHDDYERLYAEERRKEQELLAANNEDAIAFRDDANQEPAAARATPPAEEIEQEQANSGLEDAEGGGPNAADQPNAVEGALIAAPYYPVNALVYNPAGGYNYIPYQCVNVALLPNFPSLATYEIITGRYIYVLQLNSRACVLPWQIQKVVIGLVNLALLQQILSHCGITMQRFATTGLTFDEKMLLLHLGLIHAQQEVIEYIHFEDVPIFYSWLYYCSFNMPGWLALANNGANP